MHIVHCMKKMARLVGHTVSDWRLEEGENGTEEVEVSRERPEIRVI